MRRLTIWSLAASFVIVAVGIFAPTKSSADAIYNFYGPHNGTFLGSSAGSLGVSSFTIPGARGPITVSGFDCAATPTPCNGGTGTQANLAWKNLGTGEAGTGIANDSDGAMEISDDDFVSLNMSNLNVTSGTLWISSVQAGQIFMVCTSSSAIILGALGNCSKALGVGGGGTIAVPISWTSANPFVQVTGALSDKDFFLIGKTGGNSNDDVLLNAFTTTPEPGTLALLGLGLLGLGALMLGRRKFAVSQVIA